MSYGLTCQKFVTLDHHNMNGFVLVSGQLLDLSRDGGRPQLSGHPRAHSDRQHFGAEVISRDEACQRGRQGRREWKMENSMQGGSEKKRVL